MLNQLSTSVKFFFSILQNTWNVCRFDTGVNKCVIFFCGAHLQGITQPHLSMFVPPHCLDDVKYKR